MPCSKDSLSATNLSGKTAKETAAVRAGSRAVLMCSVMMQYTVQYSGAVPYNDVKTTMQKGGLDFCGGEVTSRGIDSSAYVLLFDCCSRACLLKSCTHCTQQCVPDKLALL